MYSAKEIKSAITQLQEQLKNSNNVLELHKQIYTNIALYTLANSNLATIDLQLVAEVINQASSLGELVKILKNVKGLANDIRKVNNPLERARSLEEFAKNYGVIRERVQDKVEKPQAEVALDDIQTSEIETDTREAPEIKSLLSDIDIIVANSVKELTKAEVIIDIEKYRQILRGNDEALAILDEADKIQQM